MDTSMMAQTVNIQRPELSKKTHSTQPILFGVQSASTIFCGRNKQMDLLTKLYLDSKKFLVTIVGIGGIGKTELAKKFARKLISESPTDCIFLNGESEESLKSSILRLATYFGVSKLENNLPRNMVDIFIEVTELRVAIKMKMLIIIDDSDDCISIVKDIITRINKEFCFVLVTTRKMNVLDFGGNILKLDTFDDETAIQIINNGIPKEKLQDVTRLCDILNNSSFALQQALSYIECKKRESSRYSIKSYLLEYDVQRMLPIDCKFRPNYIDPTISITFGITFKKVKNSGTTGLLAISLLRTLAYFEPENISVEFLSTINLQSVKNDQLIFRPTTIQLRRREALDMLNDYSLIRIENGKICIHLLIQELIRLNGISRESFHLRTLIEKIHTNIDKLQQNDMPHVISIWNYALKHKKLVKNLNPFQIINKLKDLLLHDEILEFSSHCNDLYTKILGENHKYSFELRSIIFQEIRDVVQIAVTSNLPSIEESELEIAAIVETLVDFDLNFYQNWCKLYKSLKLEKITMLQLEVLYQNGKLNSNELLSRIINLWVSIHGKSVSLQMLIDDLKNNDFQNVADVLVSKFGSGPNTSILSQIKIKSDPALLSCSNLIPEKALWYGMNKSKANQAIKIQETERLQKFFDDQCNTGILNVTVITGRKYSGKSELAENLAAILYSKTTPSSYEGPVLNALN